MSTEQTEQDAQEQNAGENGRTEPVRDAFQKQFESLEIPENIDPRLLELWIQREREEIGGRNVEPRNRVPSRRGRSLNILFAAFIGITVMCLVILLGFVQARESGDILSQACRAFLVYTAIGFILGCIAEYCVTDSVETLLREIVRRSDEAAANSPTKRNASGATDTEPVAES